MSVVLASISCLYCTDTCCAGCCCGSWAAELSGAAHIAPSVKTSPQEGGFWVKSSLDPVNSVAEGHDVSAIGT